MKTENEKEERGDNCGMMSLMCLCRIGWFNYIPICNLRVFSN